MSHCTDSTKECKIAMMSANESPPRDESLFVEREWGVVAKTALQTVIDTLSMQLRLPRVWTSMCAS